jgi:DNA-binding transcriptional ArsR family regulator
LGAYAVWSAAPESLGSARSLLSRDIINGIFILLSLREMLPEEDLRTASTIFNALGSVVRLRILKMLIETKKPLHIKAVARNLGMDYAAVYRHVHVLRTARLLEVFEVGRSRVLTPRKPDLISELVQRTREVHA